MFLLDNRKLDLAYRWWFSRLVREGSSEKETALTNDSRSASASAAEVATIFPFAEPFLLESGLLSEVVMEQLVVVMVIDEDGDNVQSCTFCTTQNQNN